MPQYLVTIHLPDNYDPSLEDEAMVRDINRAVRGIFFRPRNESQA